MSDPESNRLLKRTLAFLDAPDNDFGDFKQLVELQIIKLPSIKGRALKKFFATLNLLSSIIYHYSKENDNLISAKKCSDFVVLRTWAWILKEKLEDRIAVLKEFRKLVNTQYLVLNSYFKKTFGVASIENGLYAERGGFFEALGYPLRCFEYINDLIYYCQLRLYAPNFDKESSYSIQLRRFQKDNIINLVENNSGFYRPLLDNHSIAVLNIFLFFTKKSDLRQKDIDFIVSYIFQVIHNLIVIKIKRGRLPDGYSRINLVSEFIATGSKPEEYTDESSILIAILYELIVLFDAKEAYEELISNLDKKLNLQIPQPNIDELDIEQTLFEKHMDNEYYIENFQPLPEDFEEFKKRLKQKKQTEINYRTDEAGFPYLRTLAHNYYKNEIFPQEWRKIIIEG